MTQLDPNAGILTDQLAFFHLTDPSPDPQGFPLALGQAQPPLRPSDSLRFSRSSQEAGCYRDEGDLVLADETPRGAPVFLL